MLTVDPRIGSGDLPPLLTARGLPVREAHLQYGDVSWLGNGPEGRPVACGLERKRLGDVLNCITDSRFAGHQLPGLLATYEYVYLLVEDDYYPGPGGRLVLWGREVERRGRGEAWTYAAVEHWLATMTHKRGVIVHHSKDAKGTAHRIALLYSWWTTKDWHEHKADVGFVEQAAAGSNGRAHLRRPGIVAEIASRLPGVGWEYALAAEKQWGNPQEMVAAGIAEWAELRTEEIGDKPAVRFGQERARKVCELLAGHKVGGR